jgi:hypothetical protein
MCRPQSDSPAACSYTCPTGGVLYYFGTDTHAIGTDATAGRNDVNCPAAIAPEPANQEREYEYIDVNVESEG